MKIKQFIGGLYLVIILLFSTLCLQQCANPVMPRGGEKDIIPPKVLLAVPENYSVNFDAKKIELTFDEFVKLDNMQKNLLVSPPLVSNPEFRLRGKTLQIFFDEPLMEETTYTLFFGDAIVDLTEGNPLSDYNYVFSTGPLLDSLSLGGIVLNAFDLTVPDQAYVMLYADIPDTITADSVPYLIRPRYIARTDLDGHFTLSNLKDTVYQLFVLSDMNSNLLYDMPGEKIAFLDSLIQPVYVKPSLPDSVLMQNDSLRTDTLLWEQSLSDTLFSDMEMISDTLTDTLLSEQYLLPELDIQLFMFEEQDSVQRLLRAEMLRPGLLQFAFRYPIKNLTINELRPLPDSFEIFEVMSKTADTLLWYYPSHITDSLFLNIKQDTVINDTISLSLAPKKTTVSRRKKEEVEKPPALNLITNIKARKLDIPKPLQLRFEEPVIRYVIRDTNWLVINDDTLYNQLKFKQIDAFGFSYQLDTTFEAESRVMVRFPDSVFFGYSGKTNDTTQLNFNVPALDQYGNLFVDLIVPEEGKSYIIQLLDDKEKVLDVRNISSSGIQEYLYLLPGKYLLKLIDDRNGNGRWDTGDYLKRQQAERVMYFTRIIEIRANWDQEEIWKSSF
ncbi:MAG: Ig-like domain-containing protein [Bacteroidales bacterium]|nr:Ig-like domain-containing protein [Bacteroidales bacterium]HOI32088.1 Ig-like domain-containing protein [Bacteroidales bacterium]